MNEPFITTFTGKKVNPLNLKPEDIDIRDIAHHLALLNRFVGATKKPLSIAQHSVYVSRLVKDTPWEKEALFHDSPEAYLGDVSKWVKQHATMIRYREAEENAWQCICKALELSPDGSPDFEPIVKEADDLMVRFEALKMVSHPEHLFARSSHPKPTLEERKKVGSWYPWTWQFSERAFLDHARMLGYLV